LTNSELEFQTIEHKICKKRAEIASLKTSDMAAQYSEIITSIGIHQSEQNRLKGVVFIKQGLLDKYRNEFSDMQSVQNTESILQAKEIEKGLLNQINELEQENKNIMSRISLLKSGSSSGFSDLKISSQIEEIEQSIVKIEKQIDMSIKNHEQTIKELSLSILKEGISKACY